MKRYSFILMILTSCAVGPKFQSPSLPLPQSYIYGSVATVGDTVVGAHWWRNFNDSQLNELVDHALDNNRNILVAATRVEQARLQARMTRAQMWPSVGLELGGSANYTKSTKTVQHYSITPTLSWEVDLFGKLRRMSEASGAQAQASEQDYKNMQLSLAAEVSITYFSLLQYDLALEIARESYHARRASQSLIDSMVYYGASSGVEQQQATTLTATAAAAVEQYQLYVVQTQMSLCTLLGINPQAIPVDGMKLLSGQLTPIKVPAGLPSSLLDRRPDIRQAYYTAMAANANVGVAIANRYPSLTLTGDGGVISSTIQELFKGNPFGWAAGLQIAQPLFSFGKNKRAVEIARQESRQAILQYEQSVITALGEVESALAGISVYSRRVEYVAQQLRATQLTQQLTAELYRNGQNTYLNVLDAERDLFSTQLNYTQILSTQLSQYTTLYKALGGGF